MNARLERLADDARFVRVMNLGGVLLDVHRAARIAARTNWHRVLTPHLEHARTIYDAMHLGPQKPLSSITGWFNGGMPFSVSRDDLLKVWRERRSA